MADFTFNVALGAARYYADLVEAGTGVLKVVLLKTAEADATLRTRSTLAAVKAASGNAEADWATGTVYARKEVTATTPSPGLTVVPGTALVDLDIPDLTWANAGSTGTVQNLTDLLVCYAPATGSADGVIVPLTCHDWPEVANGADITASISASGFYRATG